jgi:hypothetical protein
VLLLLLLLSLCQALIVWSKKRSVCVKCFFFPPVALRPVFGSWPPLTRLRDHTHFRHITLGRTPLNEWSARRRDFYLTTHNTHKRHTSMPPVGFEPTIPASERPQTHDLGRAVTGIGVICYLFAEIVLKFNSDSYKILRKRKPRRRKKSSSTKKTKWNKHTRRMKFQNSVSHLQ